MNLRNCIHNIHNVMPPFYRHTPTDIETLFRTIFTFQLQGGIQTIKMVFYVPEDPEGESDSLGPQNPEEEKYTAQS